MIGRRSATQNKTDIWVERKPRAYIVKPGSSCFGPFFVRPCMQPPTNNPDSAHVFLNAWRWFNASKSHFQEQYHLLQPSRPFDVCACLCVCCNDALQRCNAATVLEEDWRAACAFITSSRGVSSVLCVREGLEGRCYNVATLQRVLRPCAAACLLLAGGSAPA